MNKSSRYLNTINQQYPDGILVQLKSYIFITYT